MTTASVFMSGRSQAVRIPKAFWLDAKRVEIRRRGDSLVLTPAKEEEAWQGLKEVAGTFSEDCFARNDLPAEDYPRMEFDENPEHFEARVKAHEMRRLRREQARGERDGR